MWWWRRWWWIFHPMMITTTTMMMFSLFALEAVAPVKSQQTARRKVEKCVRYEHEEPVCGSDGLIYPNACHIRRAQFHNENITLVNYGACTHIRNCDDWIQYHEANPYYAFQPQCQANGSYASVQCHPDTGLCWCVTPEGIPIPYTSIRWKPKMPITCKSRRRKPQRNQGRRRNGKPCRPGDRAKFNHNLINIFYTEWSRIQPRKPGRTNETDVMVNEWKFIMLDLNSNKELDRSEYNNLKLAKKAVKPEPCARIFPRSCDLNHDMILSHAEWMQCLKRDDPIPMGVENESVFPSERPLPNALVGQYEDSSSELREDESNNDCFTERREALEEASPLLIPECTPDGRYKQVQCTTNLGYCFCVQEETGKYIPGTTVNNSRPKCEQYSMVQVPMKGCPSEKKAAFLKDFMQFIQMRISTQINCTGAMLPTNMPSFMSKDEQTATCYMYFFDKNGNGVLDRNEWKAFKQEVSLVNSLRKCGKKLPRYCDTNKDRLITLTEWLQCLNIQRVSTPKIGNQRSLRAGKKNPLAILRED